MWSINRKVLECVLVFSPGTRVTPLQAIVYMIQEPEVIFTASLATVNVVHT